MVSVSQNKKSTTFPTEISPKQLVPTSQAISAKLLYDHAPVNLIDLNTRIARSVTHKIPSLGEEHVINSLSITKLICMYRIINILIHINKQ